MIFTQISCAGKDIQEVWLGGRLVWQYSRDLKLYGDMYSAVATRAVFRIPVLEYFSAGCEDRLVSGANITLSGLQLSSGDSAINTYTAAGADLITALLLSATEAQFTFTDGSARLIPIADISAYEDIFTQTETGNILDIQALLASSLETDITGANSAVNMVKALISTGSSNEGYMVTATGWAIYVERVSGLEKEAHTADAYIHILIPEKSSSSVVVKTLEDVAGRVFPAHRTASNGVISFPLGNGNGKLGDVLDTDGRILIIQYSTGGAVTNNAQLTAGFTEEKPLNTGYANRQQAIVSSALAMQPVENTSDITLLWLPIGDGEPLEQGSEIQTRNGEVLEIQWAFQIKADKENQAWEVI